jgi:hypothetical protein
MYLNGKGIFIWQIKPILNGNPAAIADAALDAGLTHVVVKVADGRYKYNFYNGQDLVPAVVDQLRQRGLKVWGWHYVYGAHPVEEANIAAVRIQQLALDGYVINAEKEFKVAAGKTMAKTLMQALRAKVSGVPVALSTYRYLSVHPEFPFQAFHPYIDLSMPQVYWQASTNSAQQLRKSYNEYINGMPGLPIIPTGPCYRVTGWAPTPEQIVAFLDEARVIGLSAANFWDWGGAADKGGILWNAIKAYSWAGSSPPPPPLPTPPPGMDPGERISRLDELAYALEYYRNRRDAISGSARITELELLRGYLDGRTASLNKA